MSPTKKKSGAKAAPSPAAAPAAPAPPPPPPAAEQVAAPITSGRATGIDVSHHQPTVDWPTVFASGVSFVGMKATEGTTYVDAKLKANRENFRAHPFVLGLYYHFARPGSAKQQAEHLFHAVGPLAPNERFVLDLEEGGPLMNAQQTLAWIEEFLTALQQPRAILYTSARIWKMFGNPEWEAHKFVDLWLPRYSTVYQPEIPRPWAHIEPGNEVEARAHGDWVKAIVTGIDENAITLEYAHNKVTRNIHSDENLLWRRPRPAWTFWQWTDGTSPPHTTPGVGQCDANYFYGDVEALRAYANPAVG